MYIAGKPSTRDLDPGVSVQPRRGYSNMDTEVLGLTLMDSGSTAKDLVLGLALMDPSLGAGDLGTGTKVSTSGVRDLSSSTRVSSLVSMDPGLASMDLSLGTGDLGTSIGVSSSSVRNPSTSTGISGPI